MTRRTWAILTGEYPPTIGGVADYTHQIARELAQCGQTVHVFAPFHAAAERSAAADLLAVHQLSDHFGLSSLRMLSRELDAIDDPLILVQYVPHAFGHRGMNLPLCLWLRARSFRNRIATMFHEVAYPFAARRPMRHNALAMANRAMAKLLIGASEKMFV